MQLGLAVVRCVVVVDSLDSDELDLVDIAAVLRRPCKLVVSVVLVVRLVERVVVPPFVYGVVQREYRRPCSFVV